MKTTLRADLPAFALGDRVFHVSDDPEDCTPGVVTGLVYRQIGLEYLVAWSRDHDEDFCQELTLKLAPEPITP